MDRFFTKNDLLIEGLSEVIVIRGNNNLLPKQIDSEFHINNIKNDDILDDLQLLINYAHQLIIDCNEFIKTHRNDEMIKLTI